MNGDFLSLAAQSLNTAVMNMLIFLYCRKTDPPPPKSKAVYMITYVLSTALFISVNRLSASLDFPIINFFFMFIYVNALCIIFFKTPPKKALLYNLFCFLFLIFSDIFTVIAWSVMKGESLKAVLSNSLYVSQAHMTDTPTKGLSVFDKCSAFYPENITQWYRKNTYVPLMLKYNGICTAAALIAFIVIMNLRRDKGVIWSLKNSYCIILSVLISYSKSGIMY